YMGSPQPRGDGRLRGGQEFDVPWTSYCTFRASQETRFLQETGFLRCRTVPRPCRDRLPLAALVVSYLIRKTAPTIQPSGDPMNLQCFLVALLALVLLPFSALAKDKPARGLDICFVDTEGGAATLIVTPAGESVLIDCGNPGSRDAERIHRAAIAAGLKAID